MQPCYSTKPSPHVQRFQHSTGKERRFVTHPIPQNQAPCTRASKSFFGDESLSVQLLCLTVKEERSMETSTKQLLFAWQYAVQCSSSSIGSFLKTNALHFFIFVVRWRATCHLSVLDLEYFDFAVPSATIEINPSAHARKKP